MVTFEEIWEKEFAPRVREQRLPGMQLPPALLKKIYQDNAHGLFGIEHRHP